MHLCRNFLAGDTARSLRSWPPLCERSEARRFAVNATTTNVSVLLNVGAGQYGPATTYSAQITISDPVLLSTTDSILAMDLDGDGRPDIAVTNVDTVVVLLSRCAQ